MQRALESWIERHHNRPPHIEALSVIAGLLGGHAEFFTGKRWIDDPFTAQATAAALRRLMAFLDLGGLVKKPSSYKKPSWLKSDSPRALGENLAFALITALSLAERDAKNLPSRLTDKAAAFADLKRMLRGLGSRKQMAEKFIEGLPPHLQI
jgi:hypothetical protein